MELVQPQTLLGFLGRVRRRYAFTQLLRHGLTGLVFGLSGLVILLIAGTQILAWYWPVILFVIAFGVGAWRFLRRMPSAYGVAQIADRRLKLHDALSTAFHYQDREDGMAQAQRAYANRVAGTLVPAHAAPIEWPKTVYAATALLLAAVTLFGIRYGILNTLDLSAPVSEAFIDVFRFSPLDRNKQSARNNRLPLPDQLQQEGLTIDEAVKDELRKIELAAEGEITTADIPDVNDLSEAARGEKGKASVEGKGVNPGEGEGGEGEQPSENGDPNDSPRDGAPEGKQQQKGAQKQQQKSGDGNSQGNQNSSLLEKMKDAFANMMNKLNMPNPGEGSQQASNQKGGEKGGADKSGNQQGAKQPGKGNDAQAGAEAQGDQQSDSAEKQANAKGQGGDKSASMQAPPDAKSGMGKADGDKSLKDAEQLQAMGKISQIIGKRAKDISGEVMVEVNGGNQKLRTQYSNTSAAHTESGGEIHRDEVPLHHQHYIQQYFEQVRKQPAPANKP